MQNVKGMWVCPTPTFNFVITILIYKLRGKLGGHKHIKQFPFDPIVHSCSQDIVDV